MNNSYKEVTVVVVSHKSKKKVFNLIKDISKKKTLICISHIDIDLIFDNIIDLSK